MDEMSLFNSDPKAVKGDLYQIEDALRELFDRLLDILADTEKFGRQTSPSIFIVYAHDSDVAGNAGAQCVRSLIKWLLALRSRLLSDKSPLRWPREGGIAVAQNILSNQFCLLPRTGVTIDTEEQITSVDKVILCGSNVLKKYYEHAFTDSYVDSIMACYNDAQSRNMQSKVIQDEIRTIVESRCNRDGFHHVLTELAFLKLRRSASPGDNGNIIPVALGGDGMKYLPFLHNCDLFLKLDSSRGLASQHKLFFNLLRQLYANSHAHTVIDAFHQCYTNANARLRGRAQITREVFREIAYAEISKAQDGVLKILKAAVRDEEWILKEWQQRTESALSQRDEIIDWLPKLHDVIDTHRENLQQRHGQTGSWILGHEKYQKWKKSEPASSSGSVEQFEANRLWLNGKPGAGKTIISSIIIEDLEKCILDPSVAMAYVFCKHREDQTPSSLMLSLVAQLARQHYRLSPSLTTVAVTYKDRKPPVAPNLLECEEMLDDEVRQFRKVFFVVDALDERLDNDYAYQLLGILQKTKASVLITSRDVGSIGDFLAGADSIGIMAKPHDVRAYLNFRCEETQAYKLRQIMERGSMDQSDVVEELVSKADGMFLLPRMHMSLVIAAVKRYPTVNTLKTAVHGLAPELHKTYDEYIHRILQSDSVEHASDVLSWVLFAKQHVGIKVIQEAISLQHCNRIDNLIDRRDLLGYCIGLIMEKCSSRETVAFVHPDMERYFREATTSDKIKAWFPNGQQRIAVSCLRCLLLDTEAQANSSLWSYAAKYWGHHIEDRYTELKPLISEYLSQSDKVGLAMRHSMQHSGLVLRAEIFSFGQAGFDHLCQHPIPLTCYGCHAAALFGIGEHFLTAEQREIGCIDSNGWTPIWWAILGGQDAMVKLLLNKGAQTNMKSRKDIPLAIWMLGVEDEVTRAITFGDMTVAGRATMGNVYLWPAGSISCFDALQNFGPRTLRIATQESSFDVIRTLAGQGLNARGVGGDSVLMTAARLWQYDVVRQLVDQGADISLRNDSGATAFGQALSSWEEYSEVDNVRVNGQVRIGHSIFISPETTLDPYSFGRREATIENMLVGLIPKDLNANSDEGQKALRLAINNRYPRVVHELLERGADPNAQNGDGSTLLGLACERPVADLFNVSKLLVRGRSKLHVGTSVSVKAFGVMDENMLTFQMGSIIKVVTHNNKKESKVLPTEFESVIRMLLDKGADIDADIGGQTALGFAAENEYLSIFRTLLAAGADITRADPRVLERLRRMLRQDEGSKGVYGKACLGTLQDFQTHDYCVLLLNFMIPQSFINEGEMAYKDNPLVRFDDTVEFNSQLRLSCCDGAEKPPNAPREWTAQNEYDQRVAVNLNREPAELLAMIEGALDKVESSRRVCRRDEFWTFGGYTIRLTDDVQLEASVQHLPWWAESVSRRLKGITTREVPLLMAEIPNFQWRLSGQGVIDAYQVGLTKRTDFWMLPTTPSRNTRRFGHLLLKSFLIRRHIDKVWQDATAEFQIDM